jgi:ATP-dependent exoDNAse (exonuclease V) beta subunit
MPIAHDITLEESTHTYRDAEGVIYTSVSTIISKFKEPFDAKAVAEKTSLKTGKSVEEILAEWATAAPYGTALHLEMEDFFTEGREGQLIQPYLPTLRRWRSSSVAFHPETIVCLRNLRIAGTADLLVESADGWSIVDWKTNKAIYQTAFKGKRMSPPLSHLEDCNYNHYSLQLSFYAKMLGLPIKKLSLVHLPRDKGTIEVIPCRDLRREVDSILEIL